MGKFIIHTEPALSRKQPVKKFVIKRGTGCFNCGKCSSICIYEAHKRSTLDYRKMEDPNMSKCKYCLSCIQFCPRGALSIAANPEYFNLGDNLYTPEIITTIIKEAECGETPVSGGGYGGPFAGKGLEGFWTDMSEIVRPTRDGIHAREYISTAVEIGRKPCDVNFLKFDSSGNPLTNIPPSVELSLPVLFDLKNFSRRNPKLLLSGARCAAELGTLAIIDKKDYSGELLEYSNHLIESFDPSELSWGELTQLAGARDILELQYSSGISELPNSLKRINPDLIVQVRIQEPVEIENAVRHIFKSGADVIHIRSIKAISETIRKAHNALVEDSVRDQITLIASGSLAEASHIPKTIILGADTVAIDRPLMIALECLVCHECLDGKPCPQNLDEIDPVWGKKRMINMLASWHNQLLEILGAMGLREVSRLRGEVGRAIFYEDLEREFINDLEKTKALRQVYK